MADAFVGDPLAVPELPLVPAARPRALARPLPAKGRARHVGNHGRLRRVPGLEIKEIDSGCCGMAGSFGYEHGHFEVSVALANRVLIPAALADPGARLVAPGFSCRSQVHGLAGLSAVHPMQILAECLVNQLKRLLSALAYFLKLAYRQAMAGMLV